MSSVEHWAVKNDCNGVFSNTLCGSRAAAEEILAEGGWGEGAYVVPVVMFEAKEPPPAYVRKAVVEVLRHGARSYYWGWAAF